MKDKYIGHAASIYRTCRIYISDAQYLYIQRHRYIDAKRTGWNQTCLKLHCLLWIRTSNVIILNITCSRSQHYLLSGQSFFFQVSVFPERPVHRHFSWKIPETTIRREVSAVTSMNRGFREAWKNGKSFLRKNSGCRVIVHNRYRNESNGQVMLS